MAVQAQYPTNIIAPDPRNRVCQIALGENTNFLFPSNYDVSNLEQFQQLQAAIIANDSSNQCRLFGTIAPTVNHVQSTTNGTIGENVGVNLERSRFSGTRKRTREVDDLLTSQRLQQFLDLTDLQQDNASAFLLPSSTSVSLRLALDHDNGINSTTSSISREQNSRFLSMLSEDISSQLQLQKDEINDFIRTQAEQLQEIIEQKRQEHLSALFAIVEKKTLKRLKEKEQEVEIVSRKNLELENRIKQLSVEAHLWQKQAKNNEAIINALKSNLQQAVALSRERSKEGCGDSEDDDAASSHHNNPQADAQAQAFKENRELKERKTCRMCRHNEISILLLPCRHLCVCKDCDIHLNVCPVCKSMKNASVQVYMT